MCLMLSNFNAVWLNGFATRFVREGKRGLDISIHVVQRACCAVWKGPSLLAFVTPSTPTGAEDMSVVIAGAPSDTIGAARIPRTYKFAKHADVDDLGVGFVFSNRCRIPERPSQGRRLNQDTEYGDGLRNVRVLDIAAYIYIYIYIDLFMHIYWQSRCLRDSSMQMNMYGNSQQKYDIAGPRRVSRAPHPLPIHKVPMLRNRTGSWNCHCNV